MEVNEIRKYLPVGWDIIDLPDHGIRDIDISIQMMVGRKVATVAVKRQDGVVEALTAVGDDTCSLKADVGMTLSERYG